LKSRRPTLSHFGNRTKNDVKRENPSFSSNPLVTKEIEISRTWQHFPAFGLLLIIEEEIPDDSSRLSSATTSSTGAAELAIRLTPNSGVPKAVLRFGVETGS
jgi:hypothetical protein